jgi:DNA polymerase III epsilon subunit family exonuclease
VGFLFSEKWGEMIFSLFRPKKVTALDALVTAMYGKERTKRANVSEAASIATSELLAGAIPFVRVFATAQEQYASPFPYSTYDLALTVALSYFKQPENVDKLGEAQLAARLVLVGWLEENKPVNPMIASTFENTLYEKYKLSAGYDTYREQLDENSETHKEIAVQTSMEHDVEAEDLDVEENKEVCEELANLVRMEKNRQYLHNYIAWSEYTNKFLFNDEDKDGGLKLVIDQSYWAEFMFGILNEYTGWDASDGIKSAANRGCLDAKAKYVGYQLDKIVDDHVSVQDGVNLLRDLQSKGSIEANFQLASRSQDDGPIKRNDELIERCYKIAAEAGHIKAQLNLGVIYMNNKKFVEAEHYISMAAKNSYYTEAKRELGRLYHREFLNTGNELYAKNAFASIRDISDNDWEADVILAEFYEKGIGVERNEKRAREILIECSFVAEGYYQCARFYRDGIGGNVDVEKAIEKLKSAIEFKHAKAAYELGLVLLRRDIKFYNIVDAIEFLGKAVEYGEGLAAKQLGLLYLNGDGVEKNIPAAKKYFEKATDLGIIGLEEFIIQKISQKPEAVRTKRQLGRRYVVIDFETTGFAANAHRVIEIGAVEIVDGRIGRSFETLINPMMKIPARSMEVHRINDEMVSRAPTAEIAFKKLIEFIGDAVLVAHNIQFELAFLRSECERFSYTPNYETICTLKFSKHLYPNLESYKLGDLLADFNIKPDGALHRALPDARCTAQLLIAMKADDVADLIP